MLCLFQARTWIYNVGLVCRSLFLMFNELRRQIIVDISGIVDHHCLNFLFHNMLYYVI